MNQRFQKHEHLRSPLDFRRVYDRKWSVSDDCLVIYACTNQLAHSRIGLSVSRKNGGAVVRNRFRRLYREAFRLMKSDLPVGLDFILIPRSPREPGLEELKKSLANLTRRLERRLIQPEAKPMDGPGL